MDVRLILDSMRRLWWACVLVYAVGVLTSTFLTPRNGVGYYFTIVPWIMMWVMWVISDSCSESQARVIRGLPIADGTIARSLWFEFVLLPTFLIGLGLLSGMASWQVTNTSERITWSDFTVGLLMTSSAASGFYLSLLVWGFVSDLRFKRKIRVSFLFVLWFVIFFAIFVWSFCYSNNLLDYWRADAINRWVILCISLLLLLVSATLSSNVLFPLADQNKGASASPSHQVRGDSARYNKGMKQNWRDALLGHPFTQPGIAALAVTLGFAVLQILMGPFFGSILFPEILISTLGEPTQLLLNPITLFIPMMCIHWMIWMWLSCMRVFGSLPISKRGLVSACAGAPVLAWLPTAFLVLLFFLLLSPSKPLPIITILAGISSLVAFPLLATVLILRGNETIAKFGIMAFGPASIYFFTVEQFGPVEEISVPITLLSIGSIVVVPFWLSHLLENSSHPYQKKDAPFSQSKR